MRLSEGDELDDALELFHNHQWQEHKPVISAEQMAELIPVLAPLFQRSRPRVRAERPKQKVANRPKPKTEGAMSQAEARRLVRERSGGMCEVCGAARATNYQHRKGKAHCSPLELWIPSNGLDVCGHGNTSGCHGLIHQNPTAAIANGWTVPSWGDPRTAPVYRLSQRVLLHDDGSFEPYEEVA